MFQAPGEIWDERKMERETYDRHMEGQVIMVLNGQQQEEPIL